MNNKEIIHAYIQKIVDLNEEEANIFSSSFKEVKVKKRQFIVQPNFVAQHRSYVIQGSFRAYVVGEEGEDYTISFAIPDWWITDYASYITQQPATMFVVAMEDGILLQIDYEKEQELKRTNHKFETFFRILAERAAMFHQKRIISNLTLTAEQRYDLFVEKYPAVAQQVPQYALATFLGMTTESLSRIRNRRVLKKS